MQLNLYCKLQWGLAKARHGRLEKKEILERQQILERQEVLERGDTKERGRC